MTPTPRDDLLTVLASVPEGFADLIGGLSAEQLIYRHGPAFPTPAELVAHLGASGIVLDSVLRQIGLEGNREVDARAVLEPELGLAGDKPGTELLADFGRVRRRTIDFLRGLPATAWTDPIHDACRGEITVGDLCELASTHEIGHLSQLRNLIAILP
ncbi:MAG TPA: DinB family protein [Candidatus Dormibacteraeota bacterium]|nr:DinB family protein [Candidatus Dormibacteraeota bacterium]